MLLTKIKVDNQKNEYKSYYPCSRQKILEFGYFFVFALIDKPAQCPRKKAVCKYQYSYSYCFAFHFFLFLATMIFIICFLFFVQQKAFLLSLVCLFLSACALCAFFRRVYTKKRTVFGSVFHFAILP